MSETEQGPSYIVLKAADMLGAGLSSADLDGLEAVIKKVDQFRLASGKGHLECTVTEHEPLSSAGEGGR